MFLYHRCLKPFTGSKCKEFQERRGLFHTRDQTCRQSAEIADKALELTNDQRLHEYTVQLLPSDEDGDDDEQEMDVDGEKTFRRLFDHFFLSVS